MPVTVVDAGSTLVNETQTCPVKTPFSGMWTPIPQASTAVRGACSRQGGPEGPWRVDRLCFFVNLLLLLNSCEGAGEVGSGDGEAQFQMVC